MTATEIARALRSFSDLQTATAQLERHADDLRAICIELATTRLRLDGEIRERTAELGRITAAKETEFSNLTADDLSLLLDAKHQESLERLRLRMEGVSRRMEGQGI